MPTTSSGTSSRWPSQVRLPWWARLTDCIAARLASEALASGSERAPAVDADRVLLSSTHLWLRTIPSSLLPKHLCRDRPRLANRFAEAWGDRERMAALLDELLVDRRNGREVLSVRVRFEIEQLGTFHARWLADPQGALKAMSARRRVRRAVICC